MQTEPADQVAAGAAIVSTVLAAAAGFLAPTPWRWSIGLALAALLLTAWAAAVAWQPDIDTEGDDSS